MRASPGPRHRSATAPVPGAPLSIPLKHSRGPPVYKRPARQTEKGARKKKKKKKHQMQLHWMYQVRDYRALEKLRYSGWHRSTATSGVTNLGLTNIHQLGER